MLDLYVKLCYGISDVAFFMLNSIYKDNWKIFGLFLGFKSVLDKENCRFSLSIFSKHVILFPFQMKSQNIHPVN